MKTAKSPSEFRFDAEKHQYWLGKKRLPGVNEMLQKIGITKDYSNVDPWYAERGRMTHLAIQMHFEGTLDESSLDPAIEAQFRAFKAYWEKHKDEKILAIERPIHNGDFAGTPDLVTENAIYDWKCSKAHDRSADLQGQGYKTLVHPKRYQSFIVVELHEDGTPEPFDYGADSLQWEAVETLYRWKKGLK